MLTVSPDLSSPLRTRAEPPLPSSLSLSIVSGISGPQRTSSSKSLKHYHIIPQCKFNSVMCTVIATTQLLQLFWIWKADISTCMIYRAITIMSQNYIKTHNCNFHGARSEANSMEGFLQQATTRLLVLVMVKPT